MSTWGRSDLEDDLGQAPDPELQRVGGSKASPRLLVPLVAATLLVGTLWLKPWAGPPVSVSVVQSPAFAVPSAGPLPATSPVPSVLPDSPSPSAEPESALAAASSRRQCLSPELWRIVSTQRVTGSRSRIRNTRTLYGAVPVRADGPADPEMPVSMLFADSMSAVGICVPRSPVVSATTTLLQVVLWQVAEDGTAREVLRPVVIDNALYDIGEAYFGPPAGEGPYWPAGRYVFEIRRMEGPKSKWIGLEFVATNG